jgi:PAS domain S-box-containing protein
MEARPDSNPPGKEPSAASSEASLKLLIDTGLLLASERSLDVIVQAALDAGLKLSGAHFGAFFYNNVSEEGEVYPLFKVSGVPASSFANFPQPRPTELFVPTFSGREIVRSADILQDPRYGRNPPLQGMPPGHLPVRSYLGVPVSSRGGEALGALLYGHPEADVFTGESESLVATVAAQAAVAMENARLAEGLSREIALADHARALQRVTADRLTQVLESTTDGVILVDRDWRITYINSYMSDLIGSKNDLAGSDFRAVFRELLEGPSQQRFRRAMEHNESGDFREYYTPFRMWAQVRVFPAPEGIAIFLQDITRRIEAEREREEALRRLTQALDAGQLGTWTWDMKTDLLDLDERAAELYGVEAHTPIKRSALRERLLTPEDTALTPENLRDALGEGGYQAEYRIDLDGRRRWISARGLTVRGEGSDEATGMIGTVQDITARKTQEETLRQSEKLAATGRLAATIAHEINNPLEAVTNLIYLCKTDPEVPSHIQRLLDTADGELARVSQIAQQTLGFYRDTSHPTEINLTDLLSGVADLFSRKLRARNLQFKLELEQDLQIFGLHGEVRQVFSNLIVNAIDASLQGRICVRARPRNHRGVEGVSVMISDEGSGIPLEIRGRLFSPFFTTKQSIGTGLGLWVTRGIVEKSGGSISFRSRTEPPTGTVFRVFLPVGIRPSTSFSLRNTNVLQ